MRILILSVLLIGASGTPHRFCETDFAFASYYGSSMVLQKAPSRAVIWGYSTEAGDDITVTMDGQDYQATAAIGPTGRPQWSVKLDARSASNDQVTITASSRLCPDPISLTNVLFGDVYVCSGQSNMAHQLRNIDDAQPDIDDVVNYPNVRSFFTATEYSTEPQYDLIRIMRNWAEPTTDNMPTFSAVCWLFGRDLNQKLGYPIGLIQTAWGGTRIQAWSSTDVNDDTECYPAGPGDGSAQNGREALWNAMIHPFLPMPIYGAIWYQGEANAGQPDNYVCAMSRMVIDWRAKWFEATGGETDPDFSFGQVQLAPNNNNANPNVGFPKLRWAQAGYVGYIPHSTDVGQHDYTNIYMAVAADLPDFDSPHGSIHPRYKRQIATRLALAAFQVAYEDNSEGRFQGPFPTELEISGDSLKITYDEGDVELDYREPTETWPVGFEICCSESEDLCPDGDGRWQAAPISSVEDGEVTITTGCDQSVMGLRYIWRESPCELELCPLYSVENDLPAPPFRRDGLIEGTIKF